MEVILRGDSRLPCKSQYIKRKLFAELMCRMQLQTCKHTCTLKHEHTHAMTQFMDGSGTASRATIPWIDLRFMAGTRFGLLPTLCPPLGDTSRSLASNHLDPSYEGNPRSRRSTHKKHMAIAKKLWRLYNEKHLGMFLSTHGSSAKLCHNTLFFSVIYLS